MADLISIDEARDHLRIDNFDTGGGPDDAWLSLWISVVSESVALWLKDSWRLYLWEIDTNGDTVTDSAGNPVVATDTGGDPIVRHVVKAACLLELASMYRFREGEGKDNVVTPDAGYGYVLNKASTALLAPLRRPTIAGAGGADSGGAGTFCGVCW